MKKNIIIILTSMIIPLLIGLLLWAITQNNLLIELSYFICAIILVVIIIGRANRNDRLNMQAYGTTRMDKTLPESIEFRRSQNILWIAAIANFVLSYIFFMFMGG